MELVQKNLQTLIKNGGRKTERLIDEKLFKLDEKNEEENLKIELDLSALGSILKENCKENRYLSGKNFRIQWEYQREKTENFWSYMTKKVLLLLRETRSKTK